MCKVAPQMDIESTQNKENDTLDSRAWSPGLQGLEGLQWRRIFGFSHEKNLLCGNMCKTAAERDIEWAQEIEVETLGT